MSVLRVLSCKLRNWKKRRAQRYRTKLILNAQAHLDHLELLYYDFPKHVASLAFNAIISLRVASKHSMFADFPEMSEELITFAEKFERFRR